MGDAEMETDVRAMLADIAEGYRIHGMPTSPEEAAVMTMGVVFERATATARIFVSMIPQAELVALDFDRMTDIVVAIGEEEVSGGH